MRHGPRRRLLSEGRVLLQSLGMRRPTGLQLRAYARILATSTDQWHLSRWVQCWPGGIRVIEEPGGTGGLERRLGIASLLLDIAPEGRDLAYRSRPRSLPGALGAIVRTLLVETGLMGVRVLRRLWRR